jgi:hypothetical protein
MGYREIPVAPLRDAFQRSGVTASELARRLGWYRRTPDGERVKRQLGLYFVDNGRGKAMRETTTLERALEIVRALGLDPADVRDDNGDGVL